MPFVNSEFHGDHYEDEYEDLICENCGEIFGLHHELICNQDYLARLLKPLKRDIAKKDTVCSKALKMYERQPYYKTLKGKEQCTLT